jgi:hypothetical protein
VHDRREASPLTSVAGATVPVPGVAGSRAPTVYARVAGNRIQYWLFYADNPHDRGIVRTGRHEGDWELVQVNPRRRLITYAQHSWAEACRYGGGRPTVYVANGSHASYGAPGRHDRPWPDPDDEADGRGRRVIPVVEPFGDWLDFRGRWGRSEASWIPGESDSPPGPKFQESRAFQDPEAFHERARACGSGAPAHPWPVYAAAVIGLVAISFMAVRTYVRLHE